MPGISLETPPTFESFTEEELHPLHYDSDGPLNSFIIDAETKAEYKQVGIATGQIIGQDYGDCPIFANTERKQSRYDLKRANEILILLSKISENADPSNLSQEVTLMQSQNEVEMAALVESCRKLRDDSLSAEQREFLLYCLDSAQEKLYTVPEAKVAAKIISLFNTTVSSVDRELLPNDVLGIIDDFYADYPFMAEQHEAAEQGSALSKERVAEFNAELKSRYQAIFEQMKAEIGDSLSNETIIDAVNRYLELRGLRLLDPETGIATGWVCEPKETINGFQVKPKLRTILSGKRTVEITWTRFEELMMHEVEIHVVRAENGYGANSLELATGLPGTSDAEEGIGLLMEQLWAGDVKETLGRDHYRYLGIAYAYGEVDGEKHSKEETFDFLSRLMIIKNIARPDQENISVATITEKQRSLCFEHVFRMFRGMPEDRVFLKDLSYYVGKQQMIELLATTNQPAAEVIDYLQQGKFDPKNPAHQAILRTLGLIGSLDDEPYDDSSN